MAYKKALRTVYTKEGNLMVVDKETGEVLENESWNKKKYRTGAHYLKVFYGNPLFKADIPDSARTLLFALAMLIPYADDAPRVSLSPIVKKAIMGQFKMSDSTIKRNLSALVGKGFIRRVCRGVYEVNPYLYAKGPSQAILRLQQSWDAETEENASTEPPEAKEE